MDIYAEHGTKVKYANKDAGYDHDQETARKYLRFGESYTVDSTDVHSFSTTVYLVEVPNVGFNSVIFD